MSSLFYGCKSLELINFPKFDTNKVTNMNFLFYECNSLNSIGLSYFGTSNVLEYVIFIL